MSTRQAVPASVHCLAEGRFLRLLRDRHWEYVTRVNARGAAFIVAVTERRELLLVEQYRIPMQARTLELPAGMIGDEAAFSGESIEDSAIRELEEETGYRGARAEVLMSGPVAAGMTSELLYLVEVRDLRQVHAGGGVEGEDITVHRPPLDGIDRWLDHQSARGLLIEPRIYTALYFLLTRRDTAVS